MCFLQQEASVSISLSFRRMVENGGTGASSTAKSLVENLHEAGGGKEAWEAKNKITEGDVASGKGMPWSEVFARNCVGLGFKSMCRDQQRLLKKKAKDKKMEEDKHHRIQLSKAATFLPMAHSKKATMTEQLVTGLQNAIAHANAEKDHAFASCVAPGLSKLTNMNLLRASATACTFKAKYDLRHQ
jgi:hypothetical protein